ncbi:MAG TPA: hypothetical protein VL860_01070, partial [Planctomycetota bacterium]|nr:hypothetical protein [Planctomycetota bacterium]
MPFFLTAADGAAPLSPPIIDFVKNFDLAKLNSWDVKAAIDKQPDGATWLKIQSGHSKPWPGVTMKAPGGSGDKSGANPNDASVWDLAKFDHLAFPVKNLGKHQVTVICRVDNAGADGTKFCNNSSITVAPGETKELLVQFQRAGKGTLNLKLFGMNGYPPQMAAAKSGQGIDPAKINQILVFLNNPSEDYEFAIGPIHAGGTFIAPAVHDNLTEATFFPFIDEFGQFIHADWPGKTHTLDDLKAQAATEAKDWKQHPAPATYDSWGGWKDGPKLDGTGFFRAEKRDGKWWLVDPDGRLFFSLGIDCVRSSDDTPIDERTTWFKDFPGDKPEFKAYLGTAWSVVHNFYQGKKPKTFNFCLANLQRKYGDDWEKQFGLAAQQRLHSWGLNTIGAWSSNKIYDLRKTPYTVILHFGGKALEGSEGYWGQFRDVFDPSFAAELKKRVEQEKGKSAGDPWCLGYFIDNEIAWGDDLSLAIATLKSPAAQTAKQVFIADLKAQYTDI